MKLILPSIVLLFFSFVASGQQTNNGSITHNGLKRDYILYVPALYNPATPAPLVLNFHGYTSNALEQMLYGDFRPIADTAGFILVHPLGTKDLLGNNHWNVGWGTSTADDIGFTAALIDSLSAQYAINPERIYSTGMSNGGFMSYTLACELSDRIAAIASVTGSMTVNQNQSCDPVHPMPVMEIHGTADGTVAYEGNILFTPIPSVLAFWTQFNQCETSPEINPIPDIDTADGCTAEHHLYKNGNQGVEVEHYKIIGGEHTWPGSFFGGVGTNQDINASKEIWRFFSQYDIHGRINSTSTEDARPVSFQFYPNPAIDHIILERKADTQIPLTLFTIYGQPLHSCTVYNARFELDISAYPAGMYILTLGEQSFTFVKQD